MIVVQRWQRRLPNSNRERLFTKSGEELESVLNPAQGIALDTKPCNVSEVHSIRDPSSLAIYGSPISMRRASLTCQVVVACERCCLCRKKERGKALARFRRKVAEVENSRLLAEREPSGKQLRWRGSSKHAAEKDPPTDGAELISFRVGLVTTYGDGDPSGSPKIGPSAAHGTPPGKVAVADAGSGDAAGQRGQPGGDGRGEDVESAFQKVRIASMVTARR